MFAFFCFADPKLCSFHLFPHFLKSPFKTLRFENCGTNKMSFTIAKQKAAKMYILNRSSAQETLRLSKKLLIAKQQPARKRRSTGPLLQDLRYVAETKQSLLAGLVLVSTYVGSSKNLKDLTDHTIETRHGQYQ